MEGRAGLKPRTTHEKSRNILPKMKLPEFFEEDLQLVDGALRQMLPAADATPKSIHEAMRYSVFAGGKRIRPIL